MGFGWYFKICPLILLSAVRAAKDAVTIQTENELKALMNQDADPCKNFYEYACGNWEQIHPIPDYKANFNLQQVMTEKNLKLTHELLSENIEESKQKVNPSAEDKAKVFQASCNNVQAINGRGLDPMLELLQSLGGWPVLDENWSDSNFDWLQLAADAKSMVNWNYLFHSIIYKDIFNNTGQMIPSFGGVEFIPSIRTFNATAYEKRIFETLKKFNVSVEVANITTQEILQFRVELNSLPNGQYTTRTISSLEDEIPGMNFSRYLSSVYKRSFLPSDLVAIYGIEYFKNLPQVVERRGPRATANYVLWSIVDDLSVTMGEEFLQVIHNYDKISKAFVKPLPRWRFCMDLLLDTMNTATSSLFIKKTLPEKSKEAIERMTRELKSNTHEFLLNKTWPGPHTKNKTFEKLDAFWIDLRYEDLFYDNTIINAEYENVNIDYNKFFESYLKLKVMVIDRDLQIYDTQILPTLWQQPLAWAQAVHVREENKLSLYPGILQPPLYHQNFSKYLEYSGIGNVVAHEIFHAFDDEGAKYDAYGQYEQWWTDEDYEEFKRRTRCFADQYTNYTLNGMPVVLGKYGNAENIGDNSGLKFAYRAYDSWLQENGESLQDEVVEGLNLTSRQLFFIRSAQLYCTTLRPEATGHMMVEEVHAPGPYRVIGMMVNSKDFAKQFNCPANSPLNPIKKCSIW